VLAYPEQAASFIIWNDTSTNDVYAKNTTSGQIQYGGLWDAGGVDGANFSAVVQACINDLPINGGIIFFKSGNYTATHKITLTVGSVLWGEGKRVTRIYVSPTFDDVLFYFYNSPDNFQYGLAFMHMTIYGTSNSSHTNEYGVDIYECPYVIFFDFEARGFYRGARVYHSFGVFVTNSIFSSNDHSGLFLKNCNNPVIMGSHFGKNGLVKDVSTGHGLYLERDDSTEMHARVIGNYFEGNRGHDIYINLAGYNVVSDNVIMQTRTDSNNAIRIRNSDYNNVHDNVIWCRNDNAIEILTSAADMSASYNKIHHNTIFGYSTSMTYGIRESGSGTLDSNVIEENTIIGASVKAIEVINAKVRYNIGFVTENWISFTNLANGSYVAHGLAGTPTHVTITLSTKGYGWYDANTLNSTHVQLYFSTSTASGTVYCKYEP